MLGAVAVLDAAAVLDIAAMPDVAAGVLAAEVLAQASAEVPAVLEAFAEVVVGERFVSLRLLLRA